ncbi:MAG: pilus assembly protein PilP [Mariprofundales bacterium]|nr:pilus assembly protein PilP [Mariprofundales bacterium]
MSSIVGVIFSVLVLFSASVSWANVAPVTTAASAIPDDLRQMRQVVTQFLQGMATGDRELVDRLVAQPTESRLRDKLSLMITRRMELITGGDISEDVLAPVRWQHGWALVVTRQQRSKEERDRVHLSYLLLHKASKRWHIVPRVIFSDPALNVSRDPNAQALLRWFRSNQRVWTDKFVTPLLKDQALPDAMKHLVVAPPFNIERLRDPFASYLALVTRHSAKVLLERKRALASRQREELEAFDLSSLRLVAIYTIHDQRVAMFEDSEGVGHTVHKGNYMGKYSGKITAIESDKVRLVEEVVNPLGEIDHKEVLITFTGDEAKKQ